MGQAAQRTAEQSTGCSVPPLSEPHAQRVRRARIPVGLQDLSMVFSFSARRRGQKRAGRKDGKDEKDLMDEKLISFDVLGVFFVLWVLSCRGGIRISKALFRREEEYEMDLWVVKYASRRSRIGDFSGASGRWKPGTGMLPAWRAEDATGRPIPAPGLTARALDNPPVHPYSSSGEKRAFEVPG